MTNRPGSRAARTFAGSLAVAILLLACGGDDTAAPEDTLEGSQRADQLDPLRRGPQGNVAQFVVECELSHLAYDDPIVLPWQPGKSHLHQFFGNTEVTDDPTYGNVAEGDTTCEQRRDTASYWAPALLDAEGKVVEPIKMTAYYRPGPGVDPASVEPYPAGMMMVAGDASGESEQPVSEVAWSCGTGQLREATPPECSERSTLRFMVSFPDCWDGDRLSSFGSGAHVRYSAEGVCPDTHPVAIPQLLMTIDYPSVDPEGLSLSSGSIETGHADFWNVWDQEKLEFEVENCINRDLVCRVVG